jgi:hypothetical protein
VLGPAIKRSVVSSAGAGRAEENGEELAIADGEVDRVDAVIAPKRLLSPETVISAMAGALLAACGTARPDRASKIRRARAKREPTTRRPRGDLDESRALTWPCSY